MVALGGGNVAIREGGTPIAWGGGLFPLFERKDPFPAGLQRVAAIGLGFIQGLALIDLDGPERPGPFEDISWQRDQFSLDFRTQRGALYQLEFSESLQATTWSAMPLVLGNGEMQTFTGPARLESGRYYRLRRW